MSADLIPVVQKSYDLCAGLYGHVNRFPREQRGLLGKVILEGALQMLVSLTVANRRSSKAETLQEASGRLDALRIALRLILSKRLGYVSNNGYEDLSKDADEVGRMLGGWLKHEVSPSGKEEAIAQDQRPKLPSGFDNSNSGGGEGARSKRKGGVRYMMTSPTIEKYLRLKLERSRAIVFVTTGAFCQTFFEDAVFCGETLRVAVRNLAADSEMEKILTCGIPKAKLEKYVSLLRQAGREVHVE